MQFEITSCASGDPVPHEFAFCIPADTGHVTLGVNKNPHVRWSGAPEGTQSFALICCDTEVPSVGDDVNQEGRTVPYDLPRVDFFHWVLVDIPTNVTEIAAGAACDGVTPKGKPVGPTTHGVQGRNDYTAWFDGDPDMGGTYGGYDGPCPPWNDERRHRYVFTLYALDVSSLGLKGAFGGQDARDALAGHVLAEASWEGTYALYPDAH